MATKDKLVRAGLWAAEADAVIGDFATDLTSAGSTKDDALQLTADISTVSTVAASTGVKLQAQSGLQVVRNADGADALAVYPPAGGTINGGAADAALSVAAGKTVVFVGDGTTFVAVVSA